MTLRGHNDAIAAVAYSPDGTRIATASRDQTAIIWDAVSGRALMTLRGHSNWLLGLAFSSSGKYLVTASEDRTAIVWDMTTGQIAATLRGQSDSVLDAFFGPDESYVITITLNDVIRLHPLKSQDLLALAACRASRDLNDEEIRRFNVSLPLSFNFAQRTCPPHLSWLQ
jgi:WD40 repeat protein